MSDLEEHQLQKQLGAEPVGPPLARLEPVGPSPSSVSARAPHEASFTSSAYLTYTGLDARLQDKMSLSDVTVTSLYRRISPLRLSRYMDIAAADYRLSLRLHAWNAAVSGSLLPVLHMTEVIVRNVAIGRLIANFGPDWFDKPGFLTKLGKSQMATDLADQVAARRTKVRQNDKITSYLARDLTFGFWVNIFTHKFRQDLWSRDLHTYGLPDVPKGMTIEQLHAGIDTVRELRNQVARAGPQ